MNVIGAIILLAIAAILFVYAPIAGIIIAAALLAIGAFLHGTAWRMERGG